MWYNICISKRKEENDMINGLWNVLINGIAGFIKAIMVIGLIIFFILCIVYGAWFFFWLIILILLIGICS